MDTNKNLLHSTENYAQYPVIAYNRREWKKEYIYVYIYTDLHMCINKSLYCIPENNTTL